MRTAMVVTALVVLSLTAGCGGGGGGGGGGTQLLSLSGIGTIDENDVYFEPGRYYEAVYFTATRGGFIHVSIAQAGSDPLYPVEFSLAQWEPTLEDLGWFGNGSGTAETWFNAARGSRYVVLFQNSSSYDYGTYHYSIQEVD